jgi:hypothetical protein
MRLPSTIYHLAEEANFKSIQECGLLSATRLITAAGLTESDRRSLEREQRREHTELASGVQIRDQRPMPPDALQGCLVGLAPADWYGLVNARVFFWLNPGRLDRQRAACRSRTQVVLAIDTARLIAAYCKQAEVTPINTGNARRKPALRGAATFVPYATWLKSGWESETKALGIPPRRRSHPPAELTVRDAVPDIMRFVIGEFRLPPGRKFTVNKSA